jgi:hypothetical protein
VWVRGVLGGGWSGRERACLDVILLVYFHCVIHSTPPTPSNLVKTLIIHPPPKQTTTQDYLSLIGQEASRRAHRLALDLYRKCRSVRELRALAQAFAVSAPQVCK